MKTILGVLLMAGGVLAQDGVVSVMVEQALPGAKPLDLRLEVRAGKVAAAIGRCVRFSRSPAEVDASGLVLAEGRLSGEVKFQVPSDGYQAATSGVCRLDGVAVKVAPAPAPTELARLVVDCENVVNHDEKRGKAASRRMQLIVAARDGKVFGVKAVPPGSLTDVACAPFIAGQTLTLTAGRLAGTVELGVQPQDASKPPVRYTVTVAGRVIGDLVTGQLTSQRADKDAVTGTFVGSARWGAAPASDEALCKLTIRDALGTGKFMDVYLTTSGGRLRHGFATTPNFNNATHVVEAGKLTLAEGKLGGELAVMVQPDPWIPADGKPIAWAYPLTVTVVDGEIAGTAGKCAVEGSVLDKPRLGKLTGVTLKLEGGLHGSTDWHARAFVGCEVRDGHVVGGRLSNNHTKLDGIVTGGELKIEDERLVGKVLATVKQGDGAKEGDYEFNVNVLMVGAVGAGNFESKQATATKTGRLWAAIKTE